MSHCPLRFIIKRDLPLICHGFKKKKGKKDLDSLICHGILNNVEFYGESWADFDLTIWILLRFSAIIKTERPQGS